MSEEITKEDLLNMKLHEEKDVPCSWADAYMVRVFGGWVYKTVLWDLEKDVPVSCSECFVPEVINVEAHTTDVTDRTYEFKK